jgi:hypothetical protein
MNPMGSRKVKIRTLKTAGCGTPLYDAKRRPPASWRHYEKREQGLAQKACYQRVQIGWGRSCALCPYAGIQVVNMSRFGARQIFLTYTTYKTYTALEQFSGFVPVPLEPVWI